MLERHGAAEVFDDLQRDIRACLIAVRRSFDATVRVFLDADVRGDLPASEPKGHAELSKGSEFSHAQSA